MTAPVKLTRMYRIIWKDDVKGTHGVMCPGPFTHDEACTALSKFTVRPGVRRVQLEEITEAGHAALEGLK